MRLPAIEPARSAPSVADRIDRAGAAVKNAFDAAGEVSLAAEMAQVVTQTQEATIQTTKGLNDTLNVIKSAPYVSPQRVKDMFGGKVPEGVRLTDSVAVPGQQDPVQKEREVIPMHEVIPHLFDQQAKVVVENATRGIKGRGWQDKFRLAAAADVEKARAEALDWQRAQQLADAEIQSVAQFHQMVAARKWDTAEAILDNAKYTMDVKTRETLRAEFPRMRTMAEVSDRLRGGDVAEMDKLVEDVAANQFAAPLTSEEQYALTTRARDRKEHLLKEQEEAAKKAYDAGLEKWWDGVQTGQVKSSADIPLEFKHADYLRAKAVLDAKPDRKTDNRVWAMLSAAERNNQLATMSLGDLMGYLPGLSEEDGRQWMDRWAKAKAGGEGAGKPMFSDVENAAINNVLTDHYGFDPKKEPELFETTKAQLQRNLILWRKNHPDEPMLYDTIRTEARLTTFTANTDLNRAVFTNDPDTNREWVKKYLGDGDAQNAWVTLNVGVRAATPGKPVSDQDVFDHLKTMEQERPVVTEAWERLNEGTPLDGTARAAIHSVLINPVEMKRVDAKLTAEGKATNERNRIFRIVQDMQVPQSRPLAAEREARARQDAERRDVTAAGDALRAKAKAETAAEKAARTAAEKAERDRFNNLPYWEQRAEKYAKQGWETQEADLYAQVYGRLENEDRAAQVAANGGREYGIQGKRYTEDPVRIAMEQRARAEVAATRAARKADWDARMSEARSAYRKYWEATMVNGDGSVKSFEPQGFLSFEQWLNQRSAFAGRQ